MPWAAHRASRRQCHRMHGATRRPGVPRIRPRVASGAAHLQPHPRRDSLHLLRYAGRARKSGWAGHAVGAGMPVGGTLPTPGVTSPGALFTDSASPGSLGASAGCVLSLGRASGCSDWR